MGEPLAWQSRIPSIHLKLKWSSEHFFELFLGLVWVRSTLVDYFRAVLMRIPYISFAKDSVIFFIFLTTFIFALPYILKRIDLKLVLAYLGIVLIYLLNILIFPQNLDALEQNLSSFLFSALPLMFVGVSMDPKKQYKILYYLSLISVVCVFVRVLLNPINMTEGNMHSSYVLLPHVCLVMLGTFNKKNIMNIFVTILGGFTIMAYGSRGPILCILVLLVIYMFIFKKIYKHFKFFIFTIVTVLLISLMYEEIIEFIGGVVQQFGMSTRVFDYILAGNFIESKGRERIREQLYQAIIENWFGYGIAGDRAIVGTYAHNLMLELWISFGVFGGTVLLVVPVFFLTKLLFQKGKVCIEGDSLILVLTASSFVKLFMSGSYLTEPLLFLLIGMVVAEYRKININEKYRIEN